MFSKSKTGSRAAFLSLLFLACGLTASAGTLPASNWQKDVTRNAAVLQKGDYAASLTTSDRMLTEMVKYLGAGAAEDETLATVLTHKALASAGLGNIDDALWYWYIAQAISPAAAKSDLSAFGAAGEYLKRHPFSYAGIPAGTGVAPARVLKQFAPSFPSGASRFGAGDLVVQIVIDRKGQPTLPRIIHPLPAPTLSFAALEALKRWQFQPATRNGEPVPAVFDLTVHYKL
ncbi:MAG: periplasmic protein TonB [Thermoanaerobaculia bacterium]|jgi:TonB family protein|nr:periplasmic protein TonB [Thermoanaerobaculia bacterium]